MTVAIKQFKGNGYYIAMEWDKTNIYRVGVYPEHSNNMYGYPVKEMIYALNERKNAEATFRRYVRVYGKGLSR